MTPGQDRLGGRPSSVLCVDDSTMSRVLMTKALTRRRPHLAVITTGHGAEAIELATEHRPSLILMDGWLPDMSGTEAVRRLKLLPATRDIPIVVITGDERAELHREMRGAGAADCVVKPIDLDHLFELVDRYVPSPPPNAVTG